MGSATTRPEPRSGGEFQVNSLTTASQDTPSVAMNGSGDFVVSWNSGSSYGTDTSSSSVQAQRYDSAGAQVGDQFQVNSFTSGYQDYSSIRMDSEGSFVVAWQSQFSGDTDSSLRSIQARRFLADGSPLGDQFQVNTVTSGNQEAAAVALDPEGDFVVAWQSHSSGDTDSSYNSVQARRYDNLFRDDFESGDTSRWSVTSPTP